MDLSIATRLKDSNEIIKIEEHFKLVAGPGAGKTTFLVNHIKNILAKSNRLSKTRKVACITYTNVGVDTILGRLKDSIDNIEVSTIHNFLYKNVVKPYLWILKDEFKFDYENINGHDVIIPTYSLLNEWATKTNQKYLLKNQKKLIEAFTNLKWEIENDKVLLFFSKPYYKKVDDYSIKNNSLMEYKKICWSKGFISHDDILYLSYMIINKEPRVLEILRSKFPYLIVDEFQDTNPIQTKIILQIANKETIVGVIGDEWQSIYEFQGAKVKDFEEFYIENMKIYKLENNHRSTQEIIGVLNKMRDEAEFIQVSPEGKSGEKPYILVGDFFNAYDTACNICKDEKLYCLTYVNKMSNILKYRFEEKEHDPPEDLLNELRTFDGERGKLILNIIYSLEYCKLNKFKEAIKFMKKAYRKLGTFNDKEALKVLYKLSSKYDVLYKQSIKDFYMDNIYELYNYEAKIKSGKKANYYSDLKYRDVAISIKLENDDNSLYKTIHKSKGDEFDNVLVVISDQFDKIHELNLEFLLNAHKDNVKDRLYYVAMSRAKKRLFINIPKLDKKKINELYQMNMFNVLYV